MAEMLAEDLRRALAKLDAAPHHEAPPGAAHPAAHRAPKKSKRHKLC
jgi:hypothetical protein